MKKLVLTCVLISLLSVSCDQSSKGNWSDNDKALARKDMLQGLESGDEDNMFSDKAKNKLCDCAIEKIENHYDNFIQANSDKDGLSNVIKPCMKFLLEDLME
jgi:hypothetical protein